jgi:hypothetical protein
MPKNLRFDFSRIDIDSRAPYCHFDNHRKDSAMRSLADILERLIAEIVRRPPPPCCAAAIHWASFR